jgi:hypothetical protein
VREFLKQENTLPRKARLGSEGNNRKSQGLLVQTTVREAPSLINKAPLCLKGVKTLARDSYAKGVGRLGLSSSELAAAMDD